MATRNSKKTSPEKPATKPEQKPVRWVNIRIEDEHVPLLEEMLPNEHTVAGWYLAMCLEAQNVWVKYDAKSDAFSAGMIAENADVPGDVCGVSGWSNTPYDAIRALIYKWYGIMQQIWPEPKEKTASTFR